MRIAIFSDNFYPEISGIADSVIATAQELAKQGHTVRFFVPDYSVQNFKTAGIQSKREIDLDNGVEISRFFSVPYPTPTKQGRMVFPCGFRSINIRKFKPDVIHSHLFFGVGIEALLASKILKVPLVGTNHTAITEFVKYAPIKAKWLEPLSLKYVNWYYGKCAHVSAPSQSVFDEMCQGGFDTPHQVVSNPIYNEAFNNNYNFDKKTLKEKFGINDKTIVYAGRFAPEKNIEVIVEAVALAKKKIPNITLAMAGHGAHLDVIKKQITQLGLEENVKFLGTLNRYDLADLYKAGEIFAITSKSETQSMTLIQAMACGLPTIGVRARALPEYIEGNGILIEPDDPKSLAEEMIKIFEDPTLSEELSTRSLAFVEKFSAENIAKQWNEIYTTVLKQSEPVKQMKLSIVIPAYNEEAYVGKCIEAVLRDVKKGSRDIEIIVVNNASSDRTKEVAQSFEGVIVVDEFKKGLVRARKAGYMASNGDIIANLDSDGWLPEGWIEKVFAEFEKDPKLVALSGPYIYPEMPKSFNFIVQAWYAVGLFGHFFNQYVLNRGAMLQGGNFIVRRTAMEKIGGYDTSIEFYGEDTDVACRIQKVGKVKFTFSLPMNTSSRRFQGDGVIMTGIRYGINHIWTIFFKKPFSKVYNDFRGGEKI